MPTTTSLKHLAQPVAQGAGLALVLSAASSKGAGKGQLSMKGIVSSSVLQLWQICLSVCPGFGWDRVSAPLSSRYSAVVWIWYESNVDNKHILVVAKECLPQIKDWSVSHALPVRCIEREGARPGQLIQIGQRDLPSTPQNVRLRI